MSKSAFLKKRIKAIQAALGRTQNACYLVTKPANIKYLTGITELSVFHREIYVLIAAKSFEILHSPLVALPPDLKNNDSILLSPEKPLSKIIKSHIHSKVLWCDAGDLKMDEAERIEKVADVKLIDAGRLIESQREIKDRLEIEYLARAGKSAAEVWQEIEPEIQPGISEKKLQGRILELLELKGAMVPSEEFMPIVAFGAHTSIPHHSCTQAVLRENQPVLVDFGCRVEGYWSDMTRTIWVGNKPSSAFCQIELAVHEAYQHAYKTALSGKVTDIDKAVIDTLDRYHLSEKMPHTTGHGIGLEVHEKPSISRYSEAYSLPVKSVFTIEPGVYNVGQFGYRYENTLLKTSTDKLIELTQV